MSSIIILLIPTCFFNQTHPSIQFRSNKAHDLCPACMDPQQEPSSPGIVPPATPSNWHSPPTCDCFCPFAIHSDSVQLVNLASPPCWEIRDREWGRRRAQEGECGGRVEGGMLRNERKSEICMVFYPLKLGGKVYSGQEEFTDLLSHIGTLSHFIPYCLLMNELLQHFSTLQKSTHKHTSLIQHQQTTD